MAMKGSGGGGYGSRPHVEKSVKTGSGSHSTRPAGVSQIGYQAGDHTTSRPGSSGYKARSCTVPPSATFNLLNSATNSPPMLARADPALVARSTANQVNKASMGQSLVHRVRKVAALMSAVKALTHRRPSWHVK